MFDDDTYSYKGWMTSDYLLKRAFGAFFHYLLAVLVIYGIIMVIVIILAIFAAMITAIAA